MTLCFSILFGVALNVAVVRVAVLGHVAAVVLLLIPSKNGEGGLGVAHINRFGCCSQTELQTFGGWPSSESCPLGGGIPFVGLLTFVGCCD